MEEGPSSRPTCLPSSAAFQLCLSSEPACHAGLGWNTALGGSCPHRQTASLNLIKTSSLSALFPISQL